MIYTIRKATKNDSKEIAELFYFTEDYPNEEWGDGSRQDHIKRLIYMIKRKDNRFSYENIKVLDVEGDFAGLLLTLEGKKFKQDTFKADKTLYKMQKGIKEKFKFILLALGYLFYKECNKDEYYISNIAIKEEYRGRDLAKILMEESYKDALNKGYKKVSLRANNSSLVKFYKELGFGLVDNSKDRMVKEI